MDTFKRRLAVALMGTLAGLLFACGGGGGGTTSASSSPPAPSAATLSLVLQGTKTFHFSWAPTSVATGYVLLEDADGSSDYTPVARLPAEASAYDHEVFLPARVNARYVLQACNVGACADSAAVSVSGTLAGAVGYVKASAQELDGGFGVSVALSGDGRTMAVGMPLDDSNARGIGTGGDAANNGAENSGAVYLFARTSDGWSQQAYVKASNTGAHDHFGEQVDLSADGNVLAVGARNEDSGTTGVNSQGQSNDGAAQSGAVYLFRRHGAAWNQEAYVKALNTEAGDQFGGSLALAADGKTLAVGAPFEDGAGRGLGGDEASNGAAESGAVYVFMHNGIAWMQQAYIKSSNADAGDHFGADVALSADGKLLAASAVGESGFAGNVSPSNPADNAAPAAGAVYVFRRSGAIWTEEAYLKAPNGEAHDAFGTRIALSGDGTTLAIGADGEDAFAQGVNGDGFNNAALDSGAVYVLTNTGAGWAHQAYLKSSNAEAGDRFGTGLALSFDGNALAVGTYTESSLAPGLNGNQSDNSASASGAAYVFVRRGGTWSQQAYVKAPNPGANDQFGASVALGGDAGQALTLAVGAGGEESQATGINGDQTDNSLRSGAVYLY
ncbi:integrin [uncultured Hydrogenophaga sp.]|uniref:integrin n=1 Tax=uncultured Hydrogenophaga sp. TaxID=199683 RepID=UPI0025853C00|nr:integrin [uncultured Hydrogenophaga sp.]